MLFKNRISIGFGICVGWESKSILLRLGYPINKQSWFCRKVAYIQTKFIKTLPLICKDA